MEKKENKNVNLPETPVPPQRQMPLESPDSENNKDLYWKPGPDKHRKDKKERP